MVGRRHTGGPVEPRVPGAALLRLESVSRRRAAPRRGRRRRPELRAGRDHRHRRRVGQRPGGAGRVIVRDAGAPSHGTLALNGATRRHWSPRAASATAWRASPRTGSRRPDRRFDLTENVVLGRLSQAGASPPRLHGLAQRRGLRAEDIIEAYDVRCPGPEARVRLLSGGNMQKLILGRVLAGAADHPGQPADARAGRGGRRLCACRLIAARDPGRGDPADLGRPR